MGAFPAPFASRGAPRRRRGREVEGEGGGEYRSRTLRYHRQCSASFRCRFFFFFCLSLLCFVYFLVLLCVMCFVFAVLCFSLCFSLWCMCCVFSVLLSNIINFSENLGVSYSPFQKLVAGQRNLGQEGLAKGNRRIASGSPVFKTHIFTMVVWVALSNGCSEQPFVRRRFFCWVFQSSMRCFKVGMKSRNDASRGKHKSLLFIYVFLFGMISQRETPSVPSSGLLRPLKASESLERPQGLEGLVQLMRAT